MEDLLLIYKYHLIHFQLRACNVITCFLGRSVGQLVVVDCDTSNAENMSKDTVKRDGDEEEEDERPPRTSRKRRQWRMRMRGQAVTSCLQD